MKLHLLPKTALGKWSVALIIAFTVLLVSFQILVASGQRGGQTFFSNLVLAVPMLFAGISGVSAFVTGLIGIIKSRERSIIVYLVSAIGLLILLWGLAEVLFPH